VLRIVESWDGWLAIVWEGRGEMGKKKKEKQRKRVSAEGWVYNGFYRWNHRRTFSVGDSISNSTTSLYDNLSLNPSVIPSVKSSDITTPLHISRQTVYPVGETVGISDRIFSSVYTDRFIDGYKPSVYTDKFWDGIMFVGNYYRQKNSVGNSVGFLRFSGSESLLKNKNNVERWYQKRKQDK